MNRIDQKFKDLKARKKAAFIPFITAGDPNLQTTEQLALSFEGAGADILELGVPFSDPIADGPTIQASSQRALKNKVNLEQILALVERLRAKSQMPIALMTYYNPVLHFGLEKFCRFAKAAGVDGLIVPDLPPEEAEDLICLAKAQDLSMVFFAAPTTPKSRLSLIIKAASGFIYYVSLTGVTGARSDLPPEVIKNVQRIKQLTDKPVCVGFGISTPQQVKDIGAVADGVIVASAIINKMQEHAGSKDLISAISNYVQSLSSSVIARTADLKQSF